MSLPRVGLSAYVEDARWGVWDQPAALLPTNYVEAVAAAGGLPVLLPPIVPGDAAIDDAAATAVAALDALVLTGGPDIEPSRYGADVHAETDRPRVERDAWELSLLRAAIDADVPVLAVCRGIQLLNVACGGTLHQHLPDVTDADASSHRPQLGTFGGVAITVEPGSRLAGIVGEQVTGSCHHHQAIDRVGNGLVVTARATDGTVEAVEHTDTKRFVLGVQWHPEQDNDTRLFAAVIEASKQ